MEPKKSSFTLGEIVHAGDQAGIPRNLRAMPTRTPRKNLDRDEVRAAIFGYLKGRVGQKISLSEINELNGWAQTTAERNTRELMAEGWVTRKPLQTHFGKGAANTYIVHETRVPKEERTVIVKRGRTKKQDGPVLKSMDENIMAERKQRADDIAKLEQVQRDTLFTGRMDAEMWSYLRTVQSTDGVNLGRQTAALRDFSNYLHTKLEKLNGQSNRQGASDPVRQESDASGSTHTSGGERDDSQGAGA